MKKFKEFARNELKKEIIQDLRYLKACRKLSSQEKLKQDVTYLFFLARVKRMFHDRQHNRFKQYKKIYTFYQYYIKNQDLILIGA